MDKHTIDVDWLVKEEIPCSWPVVYYERQLRICLQKAQKRALASQRSILVSFTQPIPFFDSALLTTAPPFAYGTRFFWEKPVEGRVFVGLGEVACLEASGESRFATVNSHWQDLLEEAVVYSLSDTEVQAPIDHICGPLLFGGFPFDKHSGTTSLWQGFEKAMLVLPYMLLSARSNYMTLTVNRLVLPESNSEQIAHEIMAHFRALHTHIEHALVEAFIPEIQAINAKLVPCSDPSLLKDEDWMKAVEYAVRDIQANLYQKTVLARGVKLALDPPTAAFSIPQLLQQLRQNYPSAWTFMLHRNNRTFCGATPEKLVSVWQRRVQTMALAGSTPRGKTAEEDQVLGEGLLHSAKNQGEHAFVVHSIQAELEKLCSLVSIGDTPHLLKLANIQHLLTPIEGRLLSQHTILDVVALLHPTPAVGGVPRAEALEAIRKYEQLDRGWYSGPIGWIDSTGNGEFAVALRCGILDQQTAVLFAGCGIVADSDPVYEYEESCLKLRAMLDNLQRSIYAA